MQPDLNQIQAGINLLVNRLLPRQSVDGSWRLGFIDSGTSTDAAAIMLLQSMQVPKPKLVAALRERIELMQGSDGAWRIYPNEAPGHAAATAECYFALQFAGRTPNEPHMKRARESLQALGGLSRIESLVTKFLLAAVGQYRWPRWFPVPLTLMLLPKSAPLHFYQFSGYARVHMAPMLILGDRKPAFTLPSIIPLEPLRSESEELRLQQGSWQRHFHYKLRQLDDDRLQLHQQATDRAVSFMQARIESDGSLYSYATATILMVHSLRALGFKAEHPLIAGALQALETLLAPDWTLHGRAATLQNTTSTVWDTALISHALQAAGFSPSHPSIMRAGQFLLSRQHTKLGDWKHNVVDPEPGGWGFSNINTIHPDNDDTTAVLRAIHSLTVDVSATSRERGLKWLLAMQNSDGGWAAFERNQDNKLISWVPLDGAEDAATDPSTPDLTGRTLEYLGRFARLTTEHHFIRRAANWLYSHQELDGSWYGRWGVCYIYGTWAALTGLASVNESPQHPRIRRAVNWLHSIQHADGGFGESCGSDEVKRFVPLPTSTLVQTAWALDALIAVHETPTEGMQRACTYLLRNLPGEHLQQQSLAARYPNGAGLPGYIYTCYESYPLIWPLLALAHYRNKYSE
ncbi:prenyltransferase/squalene oxidase repeat-containing protein [Paenibacillus sp. OV219]|uniref:terpene cyclase/mutase family protein n=1 Tax=Paenibacillus sp. OV219 TaxID=1884377 RepID=UPI0008C7BAD7|nr:prenyltransferase/squalene oxidase repeat-containing protein [Paenibacillus sp. OV219]SEM78675.1 sporulenol synthase [Paenibacillus sp. OV219]